MKFKDSGKRAESIIREHRDFTHVQIGAYKMNYICENCGHPLADHIYFECPENVPTGIVSGAIKSQDRDDQSNAYKAAHEKK